MGVAKQSDRGTYKGKPITDELLEELADEAEAGLELSKLKRRPGRPPIGSGPADVVPVRLDPELRAALAARADAEEETTSELIRRALRSYLEGQGRNDTEPSRRLTFDPPTTTVSFKFADAFPADDPVGHFVIALAAAMNDLNLFNSLLFPPDDPERSDFTEPERVALTRMLLGAIWEAHLFVVSAAKNSAVERFLDELAQAYPENQKFSGRQLVGFLRGEAGATAPAMRNVLKVARNATFHYPKVLDRSLVDVLEEFASESRKGELTYGQKMPSVRAAFADDVMLNLALRELEPRDETALGQLFSALTQTVIAVVHLAQVAVDLWLGKGTDAA